MQQNHLYVLRSFSSIFSYFIVSIKVGRIHSGKKFSKVLCSKASQKNLTSNCRITLKWLFILISQDALHRETEAEVKSAAVFWLQTLEPSTRNPPSLAGLNYFQLISSVYRLKILSQKTFSPKVYLKVELESVLLMSYLTYYLIA